MLIFRRSLTATKGEERGLDFKERRCDLKMSGAGAHLVSVYLLIAPESLLFWGLAEPAIRKESETAADGHDLSGLCSGL